LKTELRKNSLILTGTNRKGRYEFSYSTVLFFREREFPLPQEAEDRVTQKLYPDPVSMEGYPWKTPPWPHQRKGGELFLTRKRFALFHAMGSGKSKAALDATGWLFWKGMAKRVLIVCPLSVFTEWPRQHERHAAFGRMVILKTTSQAKKFLAEMDQIEEPLYVVVNYEKIPSLKDLLKDRFDVVIADEATKIKNHRAGRTKALAEVTSTAPYTLIMTGTPVSKNLVDIFGEYTVMDPFWFGKNFWFFRQRYCLMGGWMQHQIIGYQREEELRSIIDFPSNRVLKKDVLPDLPPKVYQERVITMDPEQKRVYEETRKKFLIEWQNGNIDIKNAASRIAKLQEIANGFVILEGGEIAHVSDSKVKSVLEALEELPEEDRLTIWCRFREDINMLKRGITEQFEDRGPIFEFHGDTKNRDEVLNKFRESTGSTLLIQVQTGGMGIDLTCSHTPFFYSNVFEYALREQAEDRHHRPGQKNAVNYVEFITEDTVDRKIQRVLSARKSLSEWVLEDKGKLADFFEPRGIFR
jgi:SNF2 family DNA or RNA helicase